MISRLHFLLLLFLTLAQAFGQRPIIEKVEAHLDIHSIKKATYELSKRWTVYGEQDKKAGYISLPYQSFSKIKSVELLVFNSDGKLVDKIKKKDFVDHSLSGGFEITTNRVLFYNYESANYPFTLQLNYEVRYDGLLFLPTFWPLQGLSNCRLNEARLTVSSPKDFKLRYKANMNPQYVCDSTGDNTLHTWTFASIKSVRSSEVFSPGRKLDIPYVILAPSEFEIAKTKGNQSSWLDFGDWVWSIWEGRQELPKETVAYLNKNFGALDDRQKVEQVYRWMQNKTRYVSVQKGLGGWQPIPAKEVDEHGYGDCKALVNYTQAALASVGVNSYYTLIKASTSEDIDPEFCYQAFNHVILSVPLEGGDTIWLECTNQYAPPNYLGAHTSGKHAFIIKKGGSQLISTPDAIKNMALSQTSQVMQFLDHGQSKVSFSNNLKYLNYEKYKYLKFEDQKSRKNLVEERLFASQAQIEEVAVEASYNDRPSLNLSSSFKAGGLYTSFGNSLAFAPGVLKSTIPNIPYDAYRQSEVDIRYTYIQSDTIQIEIPHGFEVEFIPADVSVETPFGQYSAQYLHQSDKIVCVLDQQLNKGVYPNSQYPDLYDFQQKIQTTFGRKIILKHSLSQE